MLGPGSKSGNCAKSAVLFDASGSDREGNRLATALRAAASTV
jgi:hypothetical protein